jgi:hypothetical protein
MGLYVVGSPREGQGEDGDTLSGRVAIESIACRQRRNESSYRRAKNDAQASMPWVKCDVGSSFLSARAPPA